MMRAFGAREEENPQSAKSQMILGIVKRNFVILFQKEMIFYQKNKTSLMFVFKYLTGN